MTSQVWTRYPTWAPPLLEQIEFGNRVAAYLIVASGTDLIAVRMAQGRGTPTHIDQYARLPITWTKDEQTARRRPKGNPQ